MVAMSLFIEPIWPTGMAHFDGVILEVTTGGPACRRGRHRLGRDRRTPRPPVARGPLPLRLDTVMRGYWVEESSEFALERLVQAAGTLRRPSPARSLRAWSRFASSDPVESSPRAGTSCASAS
jgi:hypothetical protein